MTGLSAVLHEEVEAMKEKAREVRGRVDEENNAACVVLQRNRLLEAATQQMQILDEGSAHGCRWPFGGPQRKPHLSGRPRAASPSKDAALSDEWQDLTAPSRNQLKDMLAKFQGRPDDKNEG